MPLMTNAEAFLYDFGIYATELWAMTEAQFLEWLNANCDRERPIDAVPTWIPVTERLPEEWCPVLGLMRYCGKEPPAQLVLWYLGNGHWRETWRGDMIVSTVTHWMPLPEPPKEDRKDDGDN